jgi:hypothetical protein
MADLHESLAFHPSWVFDPAIWRIVDVNDKAKVAAVARIQLELMHATMAANIRAVEALQKTLAP